jgi:hypothetical protein
MPATFTPPSTLLGGNNPSPGMQGSHTVVFREFSSPDTLPTNYRAEAIISVKANVRFDFSEYLAAIGEVYYTRDSNKTNFRDNIMGVAEPVFEKPDGIGFNAILQARF